ALARFTFCGQFESVKDFRVWDCGRKEVCRRLLGDSYHDSGGRFRPHEFRQHTRIQTITSRILGPCSRRRAAVRRSRFCQTTKTGGESPRPGFPWSERRWSKRSARSHALLLPSSGRGGRREPASGSWFSGPVAEL